MSNDKKERKGNFFGKDPKRFMRFQFTALTATAIDFIMTIFFKEVSGMEYTMAVGAGATCGAITAFSINRYWVFRSLHSHPVNQAIRYLLVVCGSVVLNTAGTYLVTENFHLQYLISKTVVGVIVGFTYSYHLSKRFVFYV